MNPDSHFTTNKINFLKNFRKTDIQPFALQIIYRIKIKSEKYNKPNDPSIKRDKPHEI